MLSTIQKPTSTFNLGFLLAPLPLSGEPPRRDTTVSKGKGSVVLGNSTDSARAPRDCLGPSPACRPCGASPFRLKGRTERNQT